MKANDSGSGPFARTGAGVNPLIVAARSRQVPQARKNAMQFDLCRSFGKVCCPGFHSERDQRGFTGRDVLLAGQRPDARTKQAEDLADASAISKINEYGSGFANYRLRHCGCP